MEPYPQKPNVTRTSKHEGSYSYEGMPREYKTKEELRKELEARWESGELDESMKPYLTFLRGGKPPKRRYTDDWHRKAQELLKDTHLSTRALARNTDKVSRSALRDIESGNFENIRKGYARSIYYYLKRVL